MMGQSSEAEAYSYSEEAETQEPYSEEPEDLYEDESVNETSYEVGPEPDEPYIPENGTAEQDEDGTED
jgi:hypothetical protein